MAYTSDPNRSYPEPPGFVCDGCKEARQVASLPPGWYRLALALPSKALTGGVKGPVTPGAVIKRMWHLCSTECLTALVAGSHLTRIR